MRTPLKLVFTAATAILLIGAFFLVQVGERQRGTRAAAKAIRLA